MADPLRNTSGNPHASVEPVTAGSPLALPGTARPDEAQSRYMLRESRSRVENVAVDVGIAFGSAAGNLRNRARNGLAIVSDRSKEVRAKLDEYADVARERARDLGREAGRRLKDLRKDSERISRERPLETVLVIGGGAFIVGFLLRLWRSHRD